MLAAAGVGTVEPPAAAVWARDSVQLAPGTQLTALGAFRQGDFFVQDPASTLVTQFAAPAPGAEVADLCAAPGGKTLELSRDASAVFSSDISIARLRRIAANVERVHATNVHVELGADRVRPLVHDRQAEVASRNVGRIETATIVDDRERHRLPAGQAHRDDAGVGVVGDVAQRLLSDPVVHEVRIR